MKTRLLLVLLFITQSSFAGVTDVLVPKKLYGKIKEEVAQMDISASVKLLDTDIAEGVGISSRYKYEVEKSYLVDHYTRIDKWNLKMDVKAGDIIKSLDDDLPLYINLSKSAEVVFARQFSSKKEALKKLPYTLKKLPVTAKRALSLNAGDFVSIPTKMNLALGASFGSVVDIVKSSANAFVVFGGNFTIQVFRMGEQKVRVKILAQRESSKNAGVSSKIDYDIFGVSVLDKQIEKLLEFDLADFGVSDSDGQQLIVDYIFDLSDEQAQKAYEQIFKSNFQFRDLGMFAEFVNYKGLEKRLYNVFEKAEVLSFEDKDKETKRVERVFKGFNKYDKDVKKIKLGLVVAKYSHDWTFLENKIAYENIEGETKKFYYPSKTYRRDNKFDIFILNTREKIINSFFGLVPLDDEDFGGEYTDVGFIYDRKDKSFRADEQVSFIQRLSDILPEHIFDKLDLGTWEKAKHKSDAVIFLQVVFKKEAFKDLKGMSYQEIRKGLTEYYKNRKLVELNLLDGFWRKLWRKITIIGMKEKRSIKKIAKVLDSIFNDDKLDGKDKIKSLLELRDYYIFRKIGLGYLISLLGEEELNEKLYIKFIMHAKDATEVSFKLGDTPYSNIYNELLYINGVLNDRSYDLRLSEKQKLPH